VGLPPGITGAGMYGTFSGMSFGLVALVALLVIALAVFASPLLAVGIFCVAVVGLLIGMSALRQRSERRDQAADSAPDTRQEGPHSHGAGAPVSGEG
jgi:membrane protein implicated in regulation of membrane protease activity